MLRSNPLAAAVLLLCVGGFSAPAIASATTVPPTVHKVGAVTWNAKKYLSKLISVRGYVLALGDGYLLFSDEATGAISSHDLPVTGAGIETMVLKGKYTLVGNFVAGGLKASNGNPNHLELTAPPQRLTP
jgi:hypothetical protein